VWTESKITVFGKSGPYAGALNVFIFSPSRVPTLPVSLSFSLVAKIPPCPSACVGFAPLLAEGGDLFAHRSSPRLPLPVAHPRCGPVITAEGQSRVKRPPVAPPACTPATHSRLPQPGLGDSARSDSCIKVSAAMQCSIVRPKPALSVTLLSPRRRLGRSADSAGDALAQPLCPDRRLVVLRLGRAPRPAGFRAGARRL
jgi:hypothetical protein